MMGRQRRLKQQRRNNERIEAEFEIFPTIEFMLDEEVMLNEDMNPDQPEDFTEADVILKRLMPVLPSFSGKNFELWAIKMEGLLGSVDLWKFVQETDMNSENKSRRAIALFLIISAIDENILSSILNEFGEVFDPNMFWHILEMKYSMKWSQKDEIVKNSDCVEGIITGIDTESMTLVDNKITCDSQEIPCDAKACEVKYDENYVSHEEWFCLMHEKQLIDELLFGEKICLSPYMQDDMTTELIKEVEIMNQPIMKDENLQNDVDIEENKIVDDSKVVEDLIGANKVDELKKVNSVFKEECVDIDSMENEIKLEEMTSIEDKCKSRKHPMVNRKNVSLQSRKEKLHHYLMAKKDMFAAGTESTANTLEWAMCELLRHPHAMNRLQEEIEWVVGKERTVKESDLVSMKYLQCVVKETLRLYPGGPLALPHESVEAATVEGYYIPKKTMLVVNVWAIGRDPKVWGTDASEFKPERFMEELGGHLHDTVMDLTGTQDLRMLPFGAGRRGCPGSSMAIIMISFALAQLLLIFDWKVEGDPSHLDMREACGASMRREIPLFVLPSLRLERNSILDSKNLLKLDKKH